MGEGPLSGGGFPRIDHGGDRRAEKLVLHRPPGLLTSVIIHGRFLALLLSGPDSVRRATRLFGYLVKPVPSPSHFTHDASSLLFWTLTEFCKLPKRTNLSTAPQPRQNVLWNKPLLVRKHKHSFKVADGDTYSPLSQHEAQLSSSQLVTGVVTGVGNLSSLSSHS